MAINLYSDMVAAVPTGSFYNPDTNILPYSDTFTQLSVATGVANTLFRITNNGHAAQLTVYDIDNIPHSVDGELMSDAYGNLAINIKLDLGDNTISLLNTDTNVSTLCYYTTRNWATLLAAITDVFSDFDAQAQQILSDSRLATVGYDNVDAIWGSRLRNSNLSGFSVDEYRELLQTVEQAYRQYGSRVAGLSEVVAAFTHIHPLLYARRFGPTWYLGQQFVKTPGRGTLGTPGGFDTISNPSTNTLPDNWYTFGTNTGWLSGQLGVLNPYAGYPYVLPPYAGSWELRGLVNQNVIDYVGHTFVATAYGSETDTVIVGISWDNGVTWTDGSIIQMYAPDNITSLTLWRSRVIGTIPWDATKAIIRVTGNAMTVRLDRVTLTAGGHTALCLGHNTTPRNQHRSKRGYFTFLWSPDEFTPSEKTLLGIPTIPVPPTLSPLPYLPGHIDSITPAHADVDRFDVNVVVNTAVQNVKGVTGYAGLAAGTKTNMSLVQRSTPRFCHVSPTMPSSVVGEAIVFHAGVATLTYTVNPDISKITLYENGIPVESNHVTVGPGANQISIDFSANPTSTYLIDYTVLIRFESAPQDVGADFVAYTWYADVFNYLALDFTPSSHPTEVGVQFDPRFKATLLERSDQDQSTSTLISDNGITQTIVDTTRWAYVDHNTISISPTIFDSNSLYYIKYNARVAHPRPRPIASIELRQASSLINLAAAAYFTVNVNQVVAPLQYFQYRITYTNVIKTSDVRLYSAMVKGLNISEYI